MFGERIQAGSRDPGARRARAGSAREVGATGAAPPAAQPVLARRPGARVFTWKQKHELPGASAIPAVHAARHAARLLPGPKRGA